MPHSRAPSSYRTATGGRAPMPFVGRAKELAKTRELLIEDTQHVGVLVAGALKEGRTRFAEELSRRHAQDFPGGVHWIEVERDAPLDLDAMAGAASADSRSLLILDDLQFAKRETVSPKLTELGRLRPSARVLATWDEVWAPLSIPELATVFFQSFSTADKRELLRLTDMPDAWADEIMDMGPSSLNAFRFFIEHRHLGSPDELFERAMREGLTPIVRDDGTVVELDSPELSEIEAIVGGVSDSLIRFLAERPEAMYELSPRRFEELVAELYRREGYAVELTPVTNDGGIDVFAVQHTPSGSFLTIIDCKRHRADRPVEVGLVRSMYGTVQANEASVGVIATTSYFTRGAIAFQEERPYRLGLQDYRSIQQMLRRTGG